MSEDSDEEWEDADHSDGVSGGGGGDGARFACGAASLFCVLVCYRPKTVFLSKTPNTAVIVFCGRLPISRNGVAGGWWVALCHSCCRGLQKIDTTALPVLCCADLQSNLCPLRYSTSAQRRGCPRQNDTCVFGKLLNEMAPNAGHRLNRPFLAPIFFVLTFCCGDVIFEPWKFDQSGWSRGIVFDL